MPERPPLAPAAPWEGKRVVLGVTGGIAAYKSVQLARDLSRLGAEVDVVLTRNAARFVGGLSFEGVTGRRVLDSLWSAEGAALHIRLAREADLILVAPATADFLARAAWGRSDDLLTTALLATRAPVILAPAMNDHMWAHPQTRRNAAHCRDVLGYRIAGPAEGALAAGEGEGPGRMVEPDRLVDWAGRALGARAAWEGRRVLVTSGPTREPLDPVRFVGNRSSGRMGHAIAREAWLRGAEVTLVTGPTSLPDPTGVSVERVETACEMRDRVAAALPGCDVQVFAAAVSDYRPEAPADRKHKRSHGEGWQLRMVENPDVALDTRDLRAEGSVTVGFALETGDPEAAAREKAERKGFDLVVANDASEEGAGFEGDTNRVALIAPGEEPTRLPLMSKASVAGAILDRVEEMLGGKRRP